MKKKQNRKTPAAAIICGVYLSLLGVALPLTVHNAYYDITRTKATVFWLLSGLFLAAAVLLLCLRSDARGRVRPVSAPDILFCVFALCQIAATAIFSGAANGFLAPDNRFQGILSFVLYLCVFLLLRRFGAADGPVRFALLLGFSLTAFIAITELFGADPLSLLALSPAAERVRFTSTVGNISFLSAMCVLFLPFAAYMAMSADDTRGRLVYALCALVALCGGLASRAESFILGLLCFIAALPVFTSDRRVLRRVPLLWTATALVSYIFGLAVSRFAIYPLSELSAILCSPSVALGASAVSVILYFLLRSRTEDSVGKCRKVYIILLAAFAAALAIFVILANTALKDDLGGTAARIFVFSPSWGTDRGAEWASFWQMFLRSSLPRKLIGGGSGSVIAWDRAHRVFSDALTDSAHNEYLHYLLTCGVIGLGAYAALLILAVRRALRRPERVRTALGLACTAYALQAAVNIAQPFTTPLFFVFLSLLLSDAEETESGADSMTFIRVSLCMLAIVLLIAGSYSSRILSVG